jgi:ABC-type cobalamin transport system permease subunit
MMRRDRECVTVVSLKANCVVFLEKVFHAPCLGRSWLRRLFSPFAQVFWELRPPVSVEVLVHGVTLVLTSGLRGRHTLATLLPPPPFPRSSDLGSLK